jgi:hypothetical protein
MQLDRCAPAAALVIVALIGAIIFRAVQSGFPSIADGDMPIWAPTVRLRPRFLFIVSPLTVAHLNSSFPSHACLPTTLSSSGLPPFHFVLSRLLCLLRSPACFNPPSPFRPPFHLLPLSNISFPSPLIRRAAPSALLPHRSCQPFQRRLLCWALPSTFTPASSRCCGRCQRGASACGPPSTPLA